MTTYGNDDFIAVILGTGLGAYNMARTLHETFQVRSIALGRVVLREIADSKIIDARTFKNFDEPQIIVDRLVALAAELNERFPGRKLLLIPTIEVYTNVVIERRDELKKHFVFSLVEPELANQIMNKTDFYATCERFNIPYPKSLMLSPEPESQKQLDGDLPFSFPVILKPSNTDIYPRLSFAGKQKVYLINDAAELRSTSAKIFAAGYQDDLIIQEYITGDETVMQVANTYSDKFGKLRFISMGQVVLSDRDPKVVGNNSAILTINNAELADSLAKLLDALNYVGTANFDIMFDRASGQYKVLEMNLRPGATSYYTMAGGANLIRCYVDDLIYGRTLPPQTTHPGLWLNLPYPVALFLAPKTFRRKARRVGFKNHKHTLWYRRDMSFKRFLQLVRIDLRNSFNALKFAKRGINKPVPGQ